MLTILTATGLGWGLPFPGKKILKELFCKRKGLKEYHEEFRLSFIALAMVSLLQMILTH